VLENISVSFPISTAQKTCNVSTSKFKDFKNCVKKETALNL